MKKVVKSVTTLVDMMLGLLGLSFIAGGVCGAYLAGENGKVQFSINNKEIIDDYKDDTENAAEVVEEESDED